MELLLFMQNDDWVYYKNIEYLLRGSFELFSTTGATFYIQGFLAYIFVLLTDFSWIPILTVIISLLCIWVFYLILKENLQLSQVTVILLVLLFAFNPLFVYSSIGFMTDNYSLFFMMLALYSFYKFENTNNKYWFSLFSIIVLIGFLLRQVILIFPIAAGLYLLTTQRKFHGIFQIVFAGMIYFAYSYFIPTTSEMVDYGVNPIMLLDFEHVILSTVKYSIYIAAFLLPLIVIFALNHFRSKLFRSIAILCSLIFLIVFLLRIYDFNFETFPMIENVFTRKGFFHQIYGNKPHFIGYYKIFNYWGIMAIILSVMAITSVLWGLIANTTRMSRFLSILTLGYMCLLIISPVMFDRYLLPLIGFVVLLVVESSKKFRVYEQLGLSVFIAFIFIISYQFSFDFVSSNKYVWERSQDIVRIDGASPSEIIGGRGWNRYYESDLENAKYLFSYDSSLPFDEEFDLIEEHKIEFPLNMFVDPTIFLFKSKTP